MVKILQNKKRVFWEALFLTLVIFLFGILIGISFESRKIDQINNYYASSEVSLTDAFVLSTFIDSEQDCEILFNSNLEFADKIYEEAILLEKYENSGKITQGMKIAHHKYDILRTFLWINNMKTLEKCGKKYHSVVYLYESETEDLTNKATQRVWSKVLEDLKLKQGNNILLIPISVDSGLVSLSSLLEKFEISKYPVVIIDDKYVVDEITSVENLEEYIE